MEGTEDLTPRLDEYIAGLKQLQEQEEARLAELNRRALACRKDVNRIGRAIKELTGDTAPKGRPVGATTKKKSTVWKISAEKKDGVRAALATHPDDGLTITQIAERTGFANETVRKAIGAMRDEEIVRKAGVLPGSNHIAVFKLMPERELTTSGASNGNH